MKIVKRNGKLEQFNIAKIEKVIKKAILETYGTANDELVCSLAKEVKVEDRDTIAKIQTKVEKVLAKFDFDLAFNFRTYRLMRDDKRNSIDKVFYSSHLLSEKFLNKYEHYPKHMDQLARFTFLRTYSRDLLDMGRRETWKETNIRAITHNVDLDPRRRTVAGKQWLKKEAKILFDAQFNLRAFLSGRALFTGGSKAADSHPLSLFNCSFVNPTKLRDFYDILFLLSVGAGVGYKITQETLDKLPKMRNDIELIIEEYKPVPAIQRYDNCRISYGGAEARIVVGDSKDGWGEAVYQYLTFMSEHSSKRLKRIYINFDRVRPSGSPLITFGGYASGPEPLQRAFEHIHEAITSDYKDSNGNVVTKAPVDGTLRAIHLMHIINNIASAIVVGGVRRSATISLFDSDDEEMLNAKSSMTLEQFSDIKMSHYWLSNNTMIFKEKPSRERLHEAIEAMKLFGEPGFMNYKELKRRHPEAEGANPCFEILLRSYQTCNLVTLNLLAYVKDDLSFDWEVFTVEAEAITRAAYRVTSLELELPHWNAAQEEDRLLGVSPSGYMDAVRKMGIADLGEKEIEFLERIFKIIRNAADSYADELGMNRSLNVTAVKPSGTLGILGMSSAGVHEQHSEYYWRTVRVAKNNPFYAVITKLNWRIEDDVTKPNDVAVVYFPVKSESKITKYEVSALEQLERYKLFQRHYTEQNTSITVTVRPEEWSIVEEWLFNNWDEFTGVSFLSLDDHEYQQAPYQTIDEKTFLDAIEGMDQLDHYVLTKYLDLNPKYKDDLDEECATGACASDRL